MEQKRLVQAFDRGLDVLVYLNTHDGASIGEVSNATGINRGIVYRLLETLRRKNYVSKEPDSPKYWLTNAVRNLADGFNDEEWIDTIAKPAVNSLGRDLMWPISLSTLSGNAMLVRASSDSQSPLVLNRYSRGFRFSIPKSASGLAYLAFSTPQHRAALIEVLLRLLDDDDDLSVLRSPNLFSRLNKIDSRKKAGPWVRPAQRGVARGGVIDYLAQVQCPTLLMYGERGQNYEKYEKPGLATAKKARSIHIPNAGSFAQMDNPRTTEKIILEFLSENRN